MAKVTVKLFGVLRLDAGISTVQVDAWYIEDVYDIFNSKITFRDTLCYINGERCKRKKTSLIDGDEIWIMSPASGG